MAPTGSDKYTKVVLSTDTKPDGAFAGQLIIEQDTGLVYEWTGASWRPRADSVEPDILVKSIPTTGTFHHLGHEGKVFIHSDQHTGITNGSDFDTLIKVPASPSDRQVHLRFNYSLTGATPGTDVEGDLVLYRDTTVSADGTAEEVNSSNDANVKTSGVTIFTGPTITDIGNQWTQGVITAARRSGGSGDQLVPEFVLTANTNYLLRLTNNSGGTIAAVNSVFFYDSGAA